MSLTKAELQSRVNNIKVALSFLSMSDKQKVIDEVCHQLFQGKRPMNTTRRVLTKLQRDQPLIDFIISLPLEQINQASCIDHCIARFGQERAPKRTALSRQWAWLKEKRRKLHG